MANPKSNFMRWLWKLYGECPWTDPDGLRQNWNGLVASLVADGASVVDSSFDIDGRNAEGMIRIEGLWPTFNGVETYLERFVEATAEVETHDTLRKALIKDENGDVVYALIDLAE